MILTLTFRISTKRSGTDSVSFKAKIECTQNPLIKSLFLLNIRQVGTVVVWLDYLNKRLLYYKLVKMRWILPALFTLTKMQWPFHFTHTHLDRLWAKCVLLKESRHWGRKAHTHESFYQLKANILSDSITPCITPSSMSFVCYGISDDLFISSIYLLLLWQRDPPTITYGPVPLVVLC